MTRTVTSKGSDNAPFCQVQLQGGLLAVAVSYPRSHRSGYHQRGKVIDFSKRSRHRALKRLSTLDFDTFRGSFITLTYENVMRDVKTAKNHLRAFLKALYAHDLVQGKIGCAVWRIEWQERGSIHFHILLQRIPYIPYDEITRLWAIASNQDPARVSTDIREIKGKKQAMQYIAKYIAKSTESSKLGNMPYLAKGEFPQSKANPKHTSGWTGRHWGIEFRNLAIWHHAYWFAWKGSTASVTKLKIIASRVWDRINLTDGKGFTLFIDSPAAWYAVLEQVLAREKEIICRPSSKSALSGGFWWFWRSRSSRASSVTATLPDSTTQQKLMSCLKLPVLPRAATSAKTDAEILELCRLRQSDYGL